ncbi:adenylate/guanylate cyclase domain-containing protein [Sandaracinus amylolyticus]|uniref:Adenylate cyclase n=1 Tax=Sandaracinus amylolyticus TaxID=927083 RepID=A0A0F6SDV7_9BACT|nr:adenylate/guanylate cyclase domain-containing protein [Sandaracinus amylolyticus]AKF04114.1 Adenylate cyclase [Sandaracinus amylolyticus]
MGAPAQTTRRERHRGERGLPLRPTLVTVVALLIVLGAGGVGLSAYVSSTQVVDGLFRDLATRIGAATTQRTLRYLEPAVPYAAMTAELADHGALAIDDEDALLAHFHAAVASNPSFTWASFARADGTYVAVQRAEEGRLRGTIRSQDADAFGALSGEGPTRWRELDATSTGFVVRDEHRGTYDARTRGWYQEAASREGGRWVRPFLFFTRRQPGFMYVMPLRDDAQLRGVFAVEYEISYLSEFLATLRVGENGRVYLLTHDGLVVAHPDGQVTEGEGDALAIARAASHPDVALREAFAAMEASGGAARWLADGGHFRFGEHLAMAHPFPGEHGMDLAVLVIAPEADFFGEVRRQGAIAVVIALVALILAVLAGVVFSNRISGALRVIADEMERIGRFELSDRPVSGDGSLVREVNDMTAVADRMKNGLRSFGKYVPRALVQELIGSGEEAVLGGRSRELTILFSDVAGFTSISEKLSPSELVEQLGEYLDALSSCVEREHGTVDKYIGDAIMAFWGAPRELSDHALRACRSALAMQQAARALDAKWQAEGKPPMKTRIGVNTGECVVGNIGSHERMNYTVMGDSVNLASRLEGLNGAYGTWIMLGETTADAVKSEMLVRPLDWVAVKGKARAILVHELLGTRASSSEAQRDGVERYREALDLYRARRFEEAAAAFERAREAFGGDDEPSAAMAQRCRAYVAEPPPSDWNGASVRHSK